MLIPNATAVPPVGAPAYAAVFIDFENVYYFLKNHYLDPQDPHDYALDLLRSLRDTLKRDHGLESLVLNAYADFDKLPAGSQGPLYLMGVSTRNVLGTDHKNAADMQLCIDALEVFYTRPAIGTFVLVAGDRDYIPVIQHLRRQARQVQVVGFRESVSGDLLQMLGQEHFIDARGLLPPERLQALEDHRAARLARGEQIRRQRQQAQAGAPSARSVAPYGAGSPSSLAPPADGSQVADAAAPYHAPPGPEGTPGEAAAFAPIRRVLSDNARRCLEYLLEQAQRYGSQQAGPPEIWASPFLRRLTDVLPELPDWERRQLLTQLRDDGVVRMEKREGEPHAFSVIILNNQHPDVRELLPLVEQRAKEAEAQAESSEQPDALLD